MIQAVQVLRFHLLELEKVLYLICSSLIGEEEEEYTYSLEASPK
jgi:hypothetical protein